MAFPLCSQVPSALQSSLWCLPVLMLLNEQSRLCPAVGLRPQTPDSDWNLRLGPSPRPAAVTMGEAVEGSSRGWSGGLLGTVQKCASHTSTNILCALRPALEPPSPHPSSWHLLQGSFLGLGGGGIGGLRADCPRARESTAGHSTGLLNVRWKVTEEVPAAS